MADVDFFKIYNDAFGDVAADRHLQHVAQTMRHAVYRSTDLICRYGGEEFGILLPNTSMGSAVHVATRIQTALRDSFLEQNARTSTRPVTLSFGISGIVPSSDLMPARLVEGAEKALYHAKEQGRNRIAIRSLAV